MPNPKQRVVSARVVFETDPRNLNATDAYIKQALKSAFRGLKNANSAIAIFDQDERLVGMDVTGNPSEEMRKVMDYEFGDDEPPTAVNL